jgi:hypothetical protein
MKSSLPATEVLATTHHYDMTKGCNAQSQKEILELIDIVN